MSVPDAGDALVAVHDAARPLVTREIIARGWNAAIENGAAVPAEPMTDSIRLVSESGNVAYGKVYSRSPNVRISSSLSRSWARLSPTPLRYFMSVSRNDNIRF